MYDLMTSTWGLGPWLFRAPYDRFDRFIEAGLNLPMISYDVDGKDGAGRSPAQVLRTVQEQAHDGAIIRLHDSSDNAAETVDLIAEWLHENGYLCVTVEELFIHNQQEMVPNEVFRNVTPKYKNDSGRWGNWPPESFVRREPHEIQ